MPSGIMVEENWPLLLEPGLRAIFFQQTDALIGDAVRPQLFAMEISEKAKEHFYGVGGMGDVPVYNGAIEYDSFDGLWETTFTHQEYAKGFAVEHKLVADDQYAVINQRPRTLAIAFDRTREKRAADQFNNAFSSSFKGADGVALVSNAHQNSPTDATTQTNTYALPLSTDSITTIRLAMRKVKDDRNELMVVRPDTLLVPPELEEAATTIVQTVNKVDSSDNNINYIRTKIKNVVVWDYLTDPDAWFLVDSTMAKVSNFWLTREALQFAVNPLGDYDLKALFRGYERYSYGWIDWRWLAGSNPS